MPRDSSVTYYQKTKKRFKKSLMKVIKIFLKTKNIKKREYGPE